MDGNKVGEECTIEARETVGEKVVTVRAWQGKWSDVYGET